MKGVQKLQRGAGRRQFVSDHLRQAGVLPQPLKIVHAFAPGSVQNHEALDESRFVVTALPLFHSHPLPHALGQPQGAEGLHHQRYPSQRGEHLRQGFRVNLEQQRRFGRGTSGLFAHAGIITEFGTRRVRNARRNPCPPNLRTPFVHSILRRCRRVRPKTNQRIGGEVSLPTALQSKWDTTPIGLPH